MPTTTPPPSPSEVLAAQKAAARTRREAMLDTIRESVRGRGYPPTVSELAAEHGVAKHVAHRDLEALERAGAIERDVAVPRGIRLVGARRRRGAS